MKKMTQEAKVGALIIASAMLAIAFAWVIGVRNPFSQSVQFYVTYGFAGGIEIGSPVRVSGIKVGRVESIEFYAPDASTADEESASAPLKVKISVRRDAAEIVRKDSRFYVNLAGIIGERYIEITPGKKRSPKIQNGDTVLGVDPPRIDQLISQSFDLAGKIKEIIDENKGDITRSIDLLYKLSGSFNKTLQWVDKSAIFKTDLSELVRNLIEITRDVRQVTDKARTPEGEKTLKLLHDLLWRLEPLDSKVIRTFLQKEGVQVKIF